MTIPIIDGHKIVLVGGENGGEVLIPPGETKYPFTYQLLGKDILVNSIMVRCRLL